MQLYPSDRVFDPSIGEMIHIIILKLALPNAQTSSPQSSLSTEFSIRNYYLDIHQRRKYLLYLEHL